jgi:hypothetical protein
MGGVKSLSLTKIRFEVWGGLMSAYELIHLGGCFLAPLLFEMLEYGGQQVKT